MTANQKQYIKKYNNLENVLSLFYDKVANCTDKNDYCLTINQHNQFFYQAFNLITDYEKIVYPLTNKMSGIIKKNDFVRHANREIKGFIDLKELKNDQ